LRVIKIKLKLCKVIKIEEFSHNYFCSIRSHFQDIITLAAKYPGNTPKTRTKSHATAKHPGKHPQNREEMHLHTKKGDRDVTFTAFS
jgi:hypothetical protein